MRAIALRLAVPLSVLACPAYAEPAPLLARTRARQLRAIREQRISPGAEVWIEGRDARHARVAVKNLFGPVDASQGKLTDKLNQAVKDLRRLDAGFEDVAIRGAKELRQDVRRAADTLAGFYTGMDLRPPELVARRSLAEMLGISRSQDPAKWSYDLLLSKKVPVVAIFNTETLPAGNDQYQAFGPKLELVMEIMGTVGADGRVRRSDFTASHPNAGGIGALPSDPAAFGQRTPSPEAALTEPP